MHREPVLGNAARAITWSAPTSWLLFFLHLSGMAGFCFALLLIYTLKLFFAVAPGVKGNQGERRRGISLFHVPSCRGGLEGMVRLRFLIVYAPWFGTEVIITVLLLLLLSPDIGSCAQSSSVHGVNDARREDACQLLCGRYEETALAKEKTTKTVIH